MSKALQILEQLLLLKESPQRLYTPTQLLNLTDLERRG